MVGRCSCGCATIDIAVDRSQARASAFTSSPAIEATTPQSDDPAAFFELLLFVEDGWLSSVEIVSYGAEPPREFPLPHVFLPPRTRG